MVRELHLRTPTLKEDYRTLQNEECWRVNKVALGPNSITKVSERLISDEPMSINIVRLSVALDSLT
jgi:hypothetical protein